MKQIFILHIFFFLAASVFAQDTVYEIHNDSLYQKIIYVKKIGIAHFKNAEDSLLIIKAIQGVDVDHTDTLSTMRSFPIGLLYADQVIAVTAIIDSIGNDSISEMQIIHPIVHLRTLPNYYAFSGIAVMVVVLFFWFLYERRNYKNNKHVSGQKTFTVVVMSICLTIGISIVLGLILFNMKGEYSIRGSLATDFLNIGITYIFLFLLQFAFMAVIVQLLQNKFAKKNIE